MKFYITNECYQKIKHPAGQNRVSIDLFTDKEELERVGKILKKYYKKPFHTIEIKKCIK